VRLGIEVWSTLDGTQLWQPNQEKRYAGARRTQAESHASNSRAAGPGGSFQIWTTLPNGDQLRRLTTQGDNASPAWGQQESMGDRLPGASWPVKAGAQPAFPDSRTRIS